MSLANALPPINIPGLRPYVAPAVLDRQFAGLLVLSVGLHAVLACLGGPDAPPDKTPPLKITLRAPLTSRVSPPAPNVEMPPSAVPVPAALPPKARQVKQTETQRSASPLTPPAGPAIALRDRPATPTVPAASEPAVRNSESAALAHSVPAAQPVRVSSNATGEPDAEADALAAYRRQLIDLFARQHSYPRLAALRGWEGEVRLRLKVARKGNLIDVQLDRSSGFEVLDQHALNLIEGYGGLPPLPEALARQEISVVVPINYKLRKTT